MERTILHLDLDTFFVSCERLMDARLNDKPVLIGRPVLIGADSDRGVVASCGYEARSFGNIATVPSPTQAFAVRGVLLGAGSTSEVFLTNATAANNTFWCLYSGVVAAGNERGQLYAETGFYAAEPRRTSGHLHLMMSTQHHLSVNPTVTYLAVGNFTTVNADGHILISPNGNYGANTFGPYSRTHLAEGVLVQNV